MSSTIRRKSIISSATIYLGFIIGFVNTYFFTKEGLFTPDEYGLTSLFVKISVLIASLATFAMPNYIIKFYPYYKDRLAKKENDLISLSVIVGVIGFLIIFLIGYLFEDFVIQKYQKNSPLFIDYYYWVYALGFGLMLFNILEAYCLSIGKPVTATFMKEVEWRVVIGLFIILFITGVIKSFDIFIKLYALSYLIIGISMLIFLIKTKAFHFTFKISKVTLRFRKVSFKFIFFVYSSILITALSQVFDTLVLSSVMENGLKIVGIVTLAELMTSIIQAPQRSIVNVSIAHLSAAWKHKDIHRINTIYHRSSINLLITSLFLFSLIALNFLDAVAFFKLKPEFALGYSAFIIMGITKIIDLGTGVNAQIIGTSSFWRFELWTGIILLCIILPLTYIFTKTYGIIGPPLATLISTIIYNSIRVVFLWKKFKLFPFTNKSLIVLLIAFISFMISYFVFQNLSGFWTLAGRSFLFAVLFLVGIVRFNVSTDIQPVLKSILKKK